MHRFFGLLNYKPMFFAKAPCESLMQQGDEIFKKHKTRKIENNFLKQANWATWAH
jgi:hypothetical protein